MSSVPCTVVDPDWKKVVIEPRLPADQGTTLTLTCPSYHFNKIEVQAVCQSGVIVPAGDLPSCLMSELQF